MNQDDQTDPRLETCRLTVAPEWIDYNGHMNVGYYVVAFDRASDKLFDGLDLGVDYRNATDCSIFIAEAHVTYDREVAEGAPLRFMTRILDADQKRIHYFHEMYHADEGYLAATNELMALHVDLGARRVCPFPESHMPAIMALAEQHAGLPRPTGVGRVMKIRR